MVFHIVTITVSIPPRKVSRPQVQEPQPLGFLKFPFHQGRFQGGSNSATCRLFPRVFPFHQGRFQGCSCRAAFTCARRFHSTKEGFKARCSYRPYQTSPVSIPPRKVSRSDLAMRLQLQHGFPFHQGRFQGSWTTASRAFVGRVSIPPRKVSREAGGADCRQRRRFPFHQGRFQGRSATSAPMFIQYSTSQSEKSVQGEKATSPCKQAIMHLSQTCVDPPPFSRHRGATHSLQGHTSKI